MAERAAISEASEEEYDDQMEALEHVSRLRDLQQEVEDEEEVIDEDEVVSEANEDEDEDDNAGYDLSAQQDEEFAPNYHEDEDDEDETEDEEFPFNEDDYGEDDDAEFVSELDLAEVSSIGTIDDDNTDDELEYTISPDMFDD
jgi:hypothetical protein